MLRAGAEHGQAAVLALAGFKPQTSTDTLVDARGDLERLVQEDAERRMQAGCRMEDGVVKAAYTAAARQQELKQDDGDPLALHNINAVSPALEELRKHAGIKCEPRPDPLKIINHARAEVEAMLNITRRGQVRLEDA